MTDTRLEIERCLAILRGDWPAERQLAAEIQRRQELYSQLWPGAQVCQDGGSAV
jgi:hypothetical protein